MLMLEFAIPAAGDMRVLRDLPERFDLGLGCVDCRSSHIDTPDEIAARVRQALEYVAAERITLHPDCGFAPGSAADIPIDEASANCATKPSPPTSSAPNTPNASSSSVIPRLREGSNVRVSKAHHPMPRCSPCGGLLRGRSPSLRGVWAQP